MPPATLPPGYALIALDEAGSTNDEAKARAEAGAPEGTVVWARQQRAGRGRRGRSWVSPPGNLYFSAVLRPVCEARNVAQLSFVAALAVLDLVDGPLPGRARGKWPNDVLMDGGKVAGVLLESALGPGGRVDWVVLGIGVNLASHPGLEGPIPSTSLVDAGAPTLAPEDALPSVLAALDRRRREWETQGFAAVRSAWLARVHGLGGPVTVTNGERRLTGVFEGLDEEGALVLARPGTAPLSISAGDVIFGDRADAEAGNAARG
ncbi:MAG: biotin--[acetyl-CoA-carboxylase] ligase [Rhodospirillales bacterium]|nr:biotin--[acetyl-CoA-carboxylase] ligase [Rhodospirillales bacterium]